MGKQKGIKMDSETFEKHFKHFRELTIHKDACDDQVNDMKTAFYAGAITFLGELLKSTDESENDKVVFKKLDDLSAELTKHFESL